MRKRLSIHDIAKDLKISAATVSYVLNGKAQEKRISTALAKRISAYVEKHDYRPNMLAKGLRTGKSKIIAMLVEGIDNPFFSSIARIVESKISQQGYKIFFASTENDTKVTEDVINIFRDAQVDGYIIAPPPGIEKTIVSLMNDGLPVVMFDRYFPGLDTCNVAVDNFEGVYKAIQHFFEMGYRKIGFVTLESSQIQMTERLKGYRKAMKEKSLPGCIKKISFELIQEQDKMTAEIKKYLEKNRHLEAVLFATNYLAISGLESIKILNLKMPDDIAVIGFDDNTYFSLFTPTITAVSQPVKELSEAVVAQLTAFLNGKAKSGKKKTIQLPARLIIRESSKATVKSAGMER